MNFLSGTSLSDYVSTKVKADDLIKEVSAASIVAKVARDKYMCELAKKYPEYGFEKHMGYGTAMHRNAISEYGICPEHRKSFEPIKSMIGFSREGGSGIVVKNTTMTGMKGEEAVCKYLEKLGHKVLFRNFKTKLYEIDIVSVFRDKIFFTEVKTRSSVNYGGGLGAIDSKKADKMKFAVESFMKFKKEFGSYSPILAVADVDGDYNVREWFTLV